MGFCCYCKKKRSHELRHFFRFPTKHYTQWVENMGWTNWTPKKSTTLCSNHFTNDCMDYRDQRVRLRKGAVPTIFGSSVNDDKLLGEKVFHGEVQTPGPTSSDVRAVPSPSQSVYHPAMLSSSYSEFHAVPSSPTTTQKLPSLPKINATPNTQINRKRSFEHDHHYSDTPTTLRKKLNAARTRILKFQSRQKVLTRQLKRSKITIQTLKSVIEQFRQYSKK